MPVFTPCFQALQRVTNTPQATHFLTVLTFIFLLVLPASDLHLSAITLKSIPIALSFGLTLSIICFAGFEIARTRRIRLSLLSGWVGLSCLSLLIAAFYHHAEPSQGEWHSGIVLLILLAFLSLQQFRFQYQQRQYLLWLILGLGWTLLPYSFVNDTATFDRLFSSSVRHLDPNVTPLMLMTGVGLSAYLLARTRTYKQTFIVTHIPLLLTPIALIPGIMAWQQAWLITPCLLSVLGAQAYLYRYSARPLHGLWNLSAALGFLLAYVLGDLPESALFSSRFSEDEWQLMSQTLDLFFQTRFQGVGLGRIEQAQLLFGHGLNNPLSVTPLYPSWFLVFITEGGVVTWLPMLVLFGLLFRRLMIAPRATRLILSTILMPSLLGIFFTSYAATQPLFLILFVILIFWLDNLSAQYMSFKITPGSWLKAATSLVLIAVVILTLGSIFLNYQSKSVHQMNNNQLTQFGVHPWWKDFYQEHADHRAFMKMYQNHDQAGQKAYLYQKMAQLAQTPSAAKYQALITLSVETQNRTIAAHLQQEAQALFPMHHFDIPTADLSAR